MSLGWSSKFLNLCFEAMVRNVPRIYITHLTKLLRVIFSEYRESEDTHEKSIFLLFHQNIPLGELIQGKIV